MGDTSLMDFLERMKIANENADTILGYEPSVGKVILYLSMAAACDCADAMKPDEAVETDIDVMNAVVPLARTNIGKWSKGGLTFDRKPEFNEDEWLDTFLDAQGFLEDTIKSHIDAYGDTPEGKAAAFNEVSNIIVYMISAICARCQDPTVPSEYAAESIRKTYRFIREECTLVPKEKMESGGPGSGTRP